MKTYDLYKELKNRKMSFEKDGQTDEDMSLDDLARVKVLSPGRKVFKRFIRNRLAVFGSVVLILLFIFSFIGPFIYGVGQKQIFYRFSTQNVNYALAKQNTTYTGYDMVDEVTIENKVRNQMNSTIKTMLANGQEETFLEGANGTYAVRMEDENLYSLSVENLEPVATIGKAETEVGTWNMIKKTLDMKGDEIKGLKEAAQKNCKGKSGSFELDGVTYSYEMTAPKTYTLTAATDGLNYVGEDLGDAFAKAAEAAAETGAAFAVDGTDYIMVGKSGNYTISKRGDSEAQQIYTTYNADAVNEGTKVSKALLTEAIKAAAAGETKFTAEDAEYELVDEDGAWMINDSEGNNYAEMTTFIIRRYSGDDTMSYELKKTISDVVKEMTASGEQKGTVNAEIPEQGEDGKYLYNEDGTVKTDATDLEIVQKDAGTFVINCDQIKYVIDMYASPSAKHPLGTDGDGFDVLSRIMYGGRVSLMVGFVVVFIETFLGIIMGGLAGYYGGWVDNLIMRMVDIFYCLPSLPIMIILGAMMDAMRMDTYLRLVILMAALGIMGWAGVARLVRGQILSLREQEFMVATEAVGIKVKSRIFKHLIPNVMPQLIVTATMGIGGVILTESTLSFLGLGVKHPLATWGTIINSVSSAAAMAHYAFIWMPVGFLICFTVIAFNFVGDGLRDAYDPRASR